MSHEDSQVVRFVGPGGEALARSYGPVPEPGGSVWVGGDRYRVVSVAPGSLLERRNTVAACEWVGSRAPTPVVGEGYGLSADDAARLVGVTAKAIKFQVRRGRVAGGVVAGREGRRGSIRVDPGGLLEYARRRGLDTAALEAHVTVSRPPT